MWPNGKRILILPKIKSKLTLLLGKALDVRFPLAGVMIITNMCHSTNQEIHGSIPCTFRFFSFFFFLISLEQETGET